MWAFLVVFPHPFLRDFSDLVQGAEHINVKYLIPIRAVKSFDAGVPCRLARLNEFQIKVVILGSFGQRRRNKLWPVIHPQLVRIPTPGHDALQYPDYTRRRRIQVNYLEFMYDKST